MESARARKTKLMQGQKEEDEAVRNMPDWVPPLRTSRPSSAEMDQSEKVDSKMTKMVIKNILFQLAVVLMVNPDVLICLTLNVTWACIMVLVLTCHQNDIIYWQLWNIFAVLGHAE